jgi:hypothetical protein
MNDRLTCDTPQFEQLDFKLRCFDKLAKSKDEIFTNPSGLIWINGLS